MTSDELKAKYELYENLKNELLVDYKFAIIELFKKHNITKLKIYNDEAGENDWKNVRFFVRSARTWGIIKTLIVKDDEIRADLYDDGKTHLNAKPHITELWEWRELYNRVTELLEQQTK